ncbi:MAG: transketolase [Alphaproteobacteria bacterium]|nr:transketolase [Alphaproteobacteria bacterium]
MTRPGHNEGFDVSAARRRCLGYRRRILGMSQKVSALHAAPAFSCIELTDTIYYGLMDRRGSEDDDVFLMSKGHGCLVQYLILNDLGILSDADIDLYCTAEGRLGAHPDYGVPGIAAATGSLGHGLGMAVGMAQADRILSRSTRVHVLLSDGEMQEGSSWEAVMMAANLGLSSVIAYLDLNDFQGLGRTSALHPAFYPVADKWRAFGWEVAEVDGHDAAAIHEAVTRRSMEKPFLLVGRTVKGRGVSFMENEPIWHYRSPSAEEYGQALSELTEVTSRHA